MRKKKQTEAERKRRRLERRREWQRRYRAADPERKRKLGREGMRRKYAAQVERDRASVRPEDFLALDERVKGLATKLHRPATTLVALSTHHDPFYITPGRAAAAAWFAEIWERLKFGTGVHVRRVHYQMISQDPPLRKQGLGSAVRDARFLGLIPSDHFIDRRNDAPIIHLTGVAESADLFVTDESPHVEVTSPAMPGLPVLWLNWPKIPQRYHIELWCEKTTVNDVLQSLAQRHGCNVVTGAGELSLTACENVVERALASQRPVRILYISDFDPAGMSMPVAVARKIEYRLRHDQIDLDFQVRPIVLTFEQCVEYELPRTPLKETDRRANRFEERFGEGATELDALEALHPGELHRIIETEIGRYHDDTLDRRIRQTAGRIERSLSTLNQEAHDSHRNEINELASHWGQIVSDYENAIEEWTDRAKTVWDAIAEDLDERKPDLSDIEWPEPAEGDEDVDPLFCSSRDYVEQIDRYKKHQDKLTERKKGNGGAP